MVDEKLIAELAAPIVEQFKELQETINMKNLVSVPQVKFIRDDNPNSIQFGDNTLNDEILNELEIYLQEELEKMVYCTVLH